IMTAMPIPGMVMARMIVVVVVGVHCAGLTGGPDLFKPPLLLSVGIEISRIEPDLIGLFQSRPFLVDDRIPRGIPVLALDDHVLAEHALEGEAEPIRGTLRRFVTVVAFPLPAAVAERVERILHEQEMRLGGGGFA